MKSDRERIETIGQLCECRHQRKMHWQGKCFKCDCQGFKLIDKSKINLDKILEYNRCRQQATKELLDKHNKFIKKLKEGLIDNFFIWTREDINSFFDKLSKEFTKKLEGGE